jgi:hypothetical protein
MGVFTKKTLGFFAMAVLLLGLTACAEEEQNRIIQYEKGTYLGKADQKLSPDQLQRLIARASGQRVY